VGAGGGWGRGGGWGGRGGMVWGGGGGGGGGGRRGARAQSLGKLPQRRLGCMYVRTKKYNMTVMRDLSRQTSRLPPPIPCRQQKVWRRSSATRTCCVSRSDLPQCFERTGRVFLETVEWRRTPIFEGTTAIDPQKSTWGATKEDFHKAARPGQAGMISTGRHIKNMLAIEGTPNGFSSHNVIESAGRLAVEDLCHGAARGIRVARPNGAGKSTAIG